MNDREREIASTLPDNLDALPRLDAFRLRGLAMTRLETFIDAAFAFAITILAIAPGNLPENVGDLVAAFRNVPAFIMSIAVLGIFWRGHWLWSRRYGLEDGVSSFISWCLIATILIYVYPMRALFGSMFYYLTSHQLGHSLAVASNFEVRLLFAAYGIGFSALCLEILLLYWRAWHLRVALRLEPLEQSMTLGQICGWTIPLSVGLLSVALSLTLPARFLDWCGWMYFSLALLVPAFRRIMARRRRAAAAS
jgi:hypothetical protein